MSRKPKHAVSKPWAHLAESIYYGGMGGGHEHIETSFRRFESMAGVAQAALVWCDSSSEIGDVLWRLSDLFTVDPFFVSDERARAACSPSAVLMALFLLDRETWSYAARCPLCEGLANTLLPQLGWLIVSPPESLVERVICLIRGGDTSMESDALGMFARCRRLPAGALPRALSGASEGGIVDFLMMFWGELQEGDLPAEERAVVRALASNLGLLDTLEG